MAKRSDRDQDAGSSRPVSDAYTGMLIISLLALIGGGTLLYLDFQQYPDREPPAVQPFKPAPKADPVAPPPPPPPMPMEPEKKPEP